MVKKIKVKVFDDLRESLQDALAFECGRALNLSVTELDRQSDQVCRGKQKP